MKAFFPKYANPRATFEGPSHLPLEEGRPLTVEDVTGLVSPFTMAELLAAIDSARLHKAPGPDALRCEVIKNCSEPTFLAIVTAINKALVKGSLPTSGKHAQTVGVPKPAKSTDSLSNIRPIALTSTPCKLSERMLAARLNWRFEGLVSYHPVQIGF